MFRENKRTIRKTIGTYKNQRHREPEDGRRLQGTRGEARYITNKRKCLLFNKKIFPEDKIEQ